MRRAFTIIVAAAVTALSACTTTENDFIIHDPAGEISSVRILLCKSEIDLIRQADVWQTSIPITCEGSGAVLIGLANGDRTFCNIGYVTSGWETSWEFDIVDGQCSTRLSADHDDTSFDELSGWPQPFDQNE